MRSVRGVACRGTDEQLVWEAFAPLSQLPRRSLSGSVSFASGLPAIGSRSRTSQVGQAGHFDGGRNPRFTSGTANGSRWLKPAAHVGNDV
jgi:hypothetical protein